SAVSVVLLAGFGLGGHGGLRSLRRFEQARLVRPHAFLVQFDAGEDRGAPSLFGLVVLAATLGGWLRLGLGLDDRRRFDDGRRLDDGLRLRFNDRRRRRRRRRRRSVLPLQFGGHLR